MRTARLSTPAAGDDRGGQPRFHLGRQGRQRQPAPGRRLQAQRHRRRQRRLGRQTAVASKGVVSEIDMTGSTPMLMSDPWQCRCREVIAVGHTINRELKTGGREAARQNLSAKRTKPAAPKGKETMSLYGALMIGVSGLDANSQALSISSSNIANVNTVGYKAGQRVSPRFSPRRSAGRRLVGRRDRQRARRTSPQQGLLTSTASPTDLAISGNGFFVVSPNLDQPAAASALYPRRQLHAGRRRAI